MPALLAGDGQPAVLVHIGGQEGLAVLLGEGKDLLPTGVDKELPAAGIIDQSGAACGADHRICHGNGLIHKGLTAARIQPDGVGGADQKISVHDGKGVGGVPNKMKGLRLSAVVARQGAVGEPALDEVKIQLVIVGHQGDRAHHQGQCHQKGQEPDKTVGALFGFGGGVGTAAVDIFHSMLLHGFHAAEA